MNASTKEKGEGKTPRLPFHYLIIFIPSMTRKITFFRQYSSYRVIYISPINPENLQALSLGDKWRRQYFKFFKTMVIRVYVTKSKAVNTTHLRDMTTKIAPTNKRTGKRVGRK